MSIAQIEPEIRRFLSNDDPEVLCVKGRWGVGKTFGWRTFLQAAKAAGSPAARRYSYVSLFGLNSLEGLRYAVFENTVTGDSVGREPDEATFGDLLVNGDAARKLGRVVGWMGTVFNRKGIADLVAQSAFLMVRRQTVCLDDLERAGARLGIREVLGLASLLKEERKCKVVLLLNDEEHDQRDEFERQLEKVADVTVRFDPTPLEAAGIALDPAPRLAGWSLPARSTCASPTSASSEKSSVWRSGSSRSSTAATRIWSPSRSPRWCWRAGQRSSPPRLEDVR